MRKRRNRTDQTNLRIVGSGPAKAIAESPRAYKSDKPRQLARINKIVAPDATGSVK
jgi:hypothetical protein